MVRKTRHTEHTEGRRRYQYTYTNVGNHHGGGLSSRSPGTPQVGGGTPDGRREKVGEEGRREGVGGGVRK